MSYNSVSYVLPSSGPTDSYLSGHDSGKYEPGYISHPSYFDDSASSWQQLAVAHHHHNAVAPQQHYQRYSPYNPLRHLSSHPTSHASTPTTTNSPSGVIGSAKQHGGGGLYDNVGSSASPGLTSTHSAGNTTPPEYQQHPSAAVYPVQSPPTPNSLSTGPYTSLSDSDFQASSPGCKFTSPQQTDTAPPSSIDGLYGGHTQNGSPLLPNTLNPLGCMNPVSYGPPQPQPQPSGPHIPPPHIYQWMRSGSGKFIFSLINLEAFLLTIARGNIL